MKFKIIHITVSFTIFLLLFFSINVKAQDVLNVKGKKYFSIKAGNLLDGNRTCDFGYNKYLSSKTVLSLNGRYYSNEVNYTKYNRGLLQFNGAYKLLNFKRYFYVYSYLGPFLGIEELKSNVEDRNLVKFPIYGFDTGLYFEQIILKKFSLTLSTDINTKFGGISNIVFITTKVGFNIYL